MHHAHAFGKISPLERVEELCHFGRVVWHMQRNRIDQRPGPHRHFEVIAHFSRCQERI